MARLRLVRLLELWLELIFALVDEELLPDELRFVELDLLLYASLFVLEIDDGARVRLAFLLEDVGVVYCLTGVELLLLDLELDDLLAEFLLDDGLVDCELALDDDDDVVLLVEGLFDLLLDFEGVVVTLLFD